MLISCTRDYESSDKSEKSLNSLFPDFSISSTNSVFFTSFSMLGGSTMKLISSLEAP